MEYPLYTMHPMVSFKGKAGFIPTHSLPLAPVSNSRRVTSPHATRFGLASDRGPEDVQHVAVLSDTCPSLSSLGGFLRWLWLKTLANGTKD